MTRPSAGPHKLQATVVLPDYNGRHEGELYQASKLYTVVIRFSKEVDGKYSTSARCRASYMRNDYIPNRQLISEILCCTPRQTTVLEPTKKFSYFHRLAHRYPRLVTVVTWHSLKPKLGKWRTRHRLEVIRMSHLGFFGLLIFVPFHKLCQWQSSIRLTFGFARLVMLLRSELLIGGSAFFPLLSRRLSDGLSREPWTFIPTLRLLRSTGSFSIPVEFQLLIYCHYCWTSLGHLWLNDKNTRRRFHRCPTIGTSD